MFSFPSTLLLQAGGGGSPYSSLIMFGAIGIIAYFFMIRPQQKKQKEAGLFLENLKKGDDIVTIGGLHGKITQIEGNMIYLEVDRGVKLKFEKSAISAENTKKLTGATPKEAKENKEEKNLTA
jgi:preprotein translocase subunit YajC